MVYGLGFRVECSRTSLLVERVQQQERELLVLDPPLDHLRDGVRFSCGPQPSGERVGGGHAET